MASVKTSVLAFCFLFSLWLLGCSSSDMKVEDNVNDARATPETSDAEEAKSVNNVAPLTAQLSAARTEFNIGESVLVDFEVTNVTDKAIKILPWNTPLESRLHGDVFTIEHDGIRALYVGRKIRRPEPTEDDYVEIAAGETLSNRVDLSQAYHFGLAGTYSVVYTPAVIADIPVFSPGVPVEVLSSSVLLELK